MSKFVFDLRDLQCRTRGRFRWGTAQEILSYNLRVLRSVMIEDGQGDGSAAGRFRKGTVPQGDGSAGGRFRRWTVPQGDGSAGGRFRRGTVLQVGGSGQHVVSPSPGASPGEFHSPRGPYRLPPLSNRAENDTVAGSSRPKSEQFSSNNTLFPPARGRVSVSARVLQLILWLVLWLGSHAGSNSFPDPVAGPCGS